MRYRYQHVRNNLREALLVSNLIFHYIVENPEQAALISSLRDIVQKQATELETLRAVANQVPSQPQDKPETLALVVSLQEQLKAQKEENDRLLEQVKEQNHTWEQEVSILEF